MSPYMIEGPQLPSTSLPGSREETSSCVFSQPGNLLCHLALGPATGLCHNTDSWHRVPEFLESQRSARGCGRVGGGTVLSPALWAFCSLGSTGTPLVLQVPQWATLLRKCYSDSHSIISFIREELNQYLMVCEGQMDWFGDVHCPCLVFFPCFLSRALEVSLYIKKNTLHAQLLSQIDAQEHKQSTSFPQSWPWHRPCLVWLCVPSVSSVLATKKGPLLVELMN